MTPLAARASCLLALSWISCQAATSVHVAVTASGETPVPDAIVILDPLDAIPPPAHDHASIDQVNKRFVPAVSVVRTGTSVTFPNSDSIRHQVYSFSSPKPFTLKLYAGAPSSDVVFDRPGLVVLGCNIHDSMTAFVGVVDSPYFTKTSASGAADLNVPAGRYRLGLWSPRLRLPGPAPELVVSADPLTVPVHLLPSDAPDAVAPWPE